MYMNRQMNVAPVIQDDIDTVLQQMEREHVRMMMQRQRQVDEFTHELENSISQLNQFLFNWHNNLIDVDTKCSFIQYYNSLCKTNLDTLKGHADTMHAIIKNEDKAEIKYELKQESLNNDVMSSTMDVNKFVGNFLQ